MTFLSLALRCFYLQYFKSDYYSSAWSKQRQYLIIQKPQRGVILDCRGRILAASNKTQTIKAEPRRIKDPRAVSNTLEPILKIDASEIYKIITESRNPGFAKIKTNASPKECQKVREIYTIGEGIGIETNWRRTYPMGPLTGHIVGFTSFDNRGLDGIELQYNEKLSGTPGKNVFFADVLRRPIRLKQQRDTLSDGLGIILTIDATIQQFARNELLKQYEKYQAESAIAIVAEPKSGAILAMVSLPDFEPAKISSTDPNNFRNRAINDQFEPGSIMKPIAVAIALDDGVIDRNEKIYCEKGYYRGKGFGKIEEYGNHRFKKLKIREIIIKSSNIGMAKIGQKLGKEKLYNGMKHFGFGRKTGIDLPGETAGLMWPLEKWTGYSITRIPYGHEITVTAIQVVRAFCMLANGGRVVHPFLVRAIVGNDGEIVKLKRPDPGVALVVKPEVARWIVTDALVGVVNEKKNGGTGWRAKLDKWQVFGKTGTANIAKSDQKGYSDSDYIASFVAGAPAEDPAVIVLVSIRKPNKKLGKGYTGGAVASPVAGKIIEKALTYLEKSHH